MTITKTTIILALFAGIIAAFFIKIRKLSTSYKEKSRKCAKWMTRCACMEDNHNYMADRLAHLAAKTFNRDIPTYNDGTQLRPGDEVVFNAILGGNAFEGEVEVNINDEGEMEDRCPLIIRVFAQDIDNDDRTFDICQVRDLRLAHRPECFQELMSSRKNQNKSKK